MSGDSPAEPSAPGSGGERARLLAGCAALFVLALVLRWAQVAQFEAAHPEAGRPAIDEASYERWALEIAGGDWLGDEIFFQEPLYPYALGVVYAVAGGGPEHGRALARRGQAVLGAAVAIGVLLLTRRLFGPAPGWVAGLAWALYRPGVWFPALLLKPNLFLPVLVVLVLALLATREREGSSPGRRLSVWAIVGLAAGAGALLRGNVLVLLPILAAWPAVRRLLRQRPLVPAAPEVLGVLVGIALVLGPVALRNHWVGGRLVLTTSGAGTNVYGGNNPDNPYGVATEFPWVRGVPEHEAGDWRREAERRLGVERLAPTEVSSFWLGEALASARSRPGLHLAILWNKLRLSLGAYEVPDNHFLEWDARHVPILRGGPFGLPGFALVGGLGLAGLIAFLLGAWRGAPGVDRGAAVEVGLLFVLYLGTIVLTVTSARARLPLVVLLLPFAAALVVHLPRLVRSGAGRVRVVAAAVVAALLVLVPVLPADERAADFDERDFNFASGRLAAGDLDGAAEVLGPLIERRGGAARVRILSARYELGRAVELLERPEPREPELDEADERIDRALRLLADVARGGNPQERFRADFWAGVILQRIGRFAAARARFESALAFDDDDRDLRRRFALCLAEEAVAAKDPAARAAGLARASEVLERLLAEEDDPGLRSLLAQVSAQAAE